LRLDGSSNLQLPLHYLYLWLWEKFFGSSEIALRAANVPPLALARSPGSTWSTAITSTSPLPAIYLARKIRAWTGLSRRMEDAVPPPWLNRSLKLAFTALVCQRAVKFPWGVGLLAVVRRV